MYYSASSLRRFVPWNSFVIESWLDFEILSAVLLNSRWNRFRVTCRIVSIVAYNVHFMRDLKLDLDKWYSIVNSFFFFLNHTKQLKRRLAFAPSLRLRESVPALFLRLTSMFTLPLHDFHFRLGFMVDRFSSPSPRSLYLSSVSVSFSFSFFLFASLA